MGRLNMQKAIEEAVRIKNPRYDMKISQMLALAGKGGVEAVSDAFNYGYMQGVKAAKADLKLIHKNAEA